MANYPNIESCREYSRAKLELLGPRISEIAPKGLNLVVTGSYSRREAHQLSDFDYFALHDGTVSEPDIDDFKANARELVQDIVGNEPGADGPWGAATSVEEIDKEIGGNNESNFSFTRRILFLLEGSAVGRSEVFEIGKRTLLERYIKKEISDHQLGLFLLNDVIRFYRTMCVDFEHKTVEQGKSWGLNNIKLVFSRKLLYFSGILVAAEMYQRTAGDKLAQTAALLGLSPIERIERICGYSADKALTIYDTFLAKMADDGFRDRIKSVPDRREQHTEEFRKLKNEGHHFSMALSQALNSTYDRSHPIHRAIIM